MRVLHGKGDEARTTSIGRVGLAVLREWHDARAKLELPVEAPLICTLAGAKLKHQYVVTMLGRLAARAGVRKRVHAHGLRHTFAHELNAEGARPTDIRDLLGHRSLATTDAYLRALGASQAVGFARSRG